ncbi:MAG: CotH kinase family protein [Clostridia bacterium]|nr:CotH kinase family protein [Clostridia bacterium]
MMNTVCKRLTALLLCLCTLLSCAPVFAQAAESPYISEIMAQNGTYKNEHAYDWVEITNPSNETWDLSGWYLSDDINNTLLWQFPENVKLKKGESLLVYCTGEDMDKGKNGEYYASFKLSVDGDDVILSTDSGALMQRFSFPRQYGNVSYGVTAEGETGFFAQQTPGKKNADTVFMARADEPVIMTPGGFYEDSVTVFAAGRPTQTLHYTLNGETPTETSPVFPAEGLTLKDTASLRVIAFENGRVPSQTAAATYLLNDSSPVAVVCLTTDNKYLFDQKTGALSKGTGSVPNYEKEWEYPIHIEYFDENGMCLINQMGTFTASGHSARQNSQKSIALYARDAFGEDRFYFNPFPNRDYDSYKSILLRSTNSDAFSTRLRDVVFTSLAEKLDIIYQDALPIQVYINGEYWGHYNLREKINKHFVAAWENVPYTDEDTVDNIDILARTGSDAYVQNGSNEDWLALCEFCKTKDLNVPENLEYVLDRLDVDSLFTHAAFEIIIGNYDITNVRMYRIPGEKWKYLLFDVEAGFLSMDAAPLENYIKDLNRPIQAFRHEPLNALLRVPEMKDKFLRRFAEMLESSFLWPYVESKFEPWENILEEILPRQNERWPYLTMKEWRQNVDAVKYYARVRPKKIVSMLARRMKLTDAEVNTYFADVQKLLDEQNTLE